MLKGILVEMFMGLGEKAGPVTLGGGGPDGVAV